MKYFLLGIALCFVQVALAQSENQVRQGHAKTVADLRTPPSELPIITFEADSIHLGTVHHGEQVPFSFTVTNTGVSDLIIEIVTTCKCTNIEWPTRPIAPGESGKITAIFDTSKQDLGFVKKTLDIVANTDPLLVEAFFTAEIIE